MATAKKKLFLIAGHGEGDPGACSIWGQEADYTRELAALVKKAIGKRMSVTLYDTSKNCYMQSKKGNIPVYSDYDMTVEIHFNAKKNADPQGNGSLTGTGGYIHPNNKGKDTARAIISQIVDLGFKEWLLDTSTGLLNLNRAQSQGAKYFLLETAFIDDGDDMKFYTANKENFARAIAQGILNGLGIKSVAVQPEPGQYYRVRLSRDDEKSQLFAGTKEGALAVCKARPGYSVFDPGMACIYTNEADSTPASGEEEKNTGDVPFRIKTTCDWLWIRQGPSKKYGTTGHIEETENEKKEYTIVEVKNGWGRLKSGIGWISLEYARKV